MSAEDALAASQRGLVRPTTPGQVVKAAGYGGNVARWMCEGTGIVRRFTRAGNPVIAVTALGYLPTEITDTLGVFRLWDPTEGKWLR